MSLSYRREIDGLRAIAVSAVVLYHAGLPVPAGFVGVDVFFVISGYLITALLLREHSQCGRIDLPAFYARRVRRIFPAAIVLVLSVLAMLPILPEHSRTGVLSSAAAALVFAANVFFQATSGGYFDDSVRTLPLLHLWSLAVEEQFYLLWPLLLIGLLRARVQAFHALALIAIASLVLAEWWMPEHPEAAFYQMPARAWELAAGALVAAAPSRALPRGSAWGGLALTVAACFLPMPHFPGLGALPAVAGSALLIAAVHGGATNPVLASRGFVGVGLISYSLYLWHWPLFAIAELLHVGAVPLPLRLALVVLAVLLAGLSYRFVETPFRRLELPSLRTVGVGAAASVLLAGCAFTLAARQPRETPVGDAFTQQCAYMPLDPPALFPKPGCSPTPASRITLWGDSMAIAFQPGVAVWDPHMGSFTRAGCPPAFGYSDPSRARIMRERCTEFKKQLAPLLQGDTLVMVAHWSRYQGLLPALDRTLAQLSPRFRRIVLIGESPTILDEAPQCLRAGAADCSVAREEYLSEPVRAELRALVARYPTVRLVDPAQYFCPGKRCEVTREGVILYTDTHHVTAAAARGFARATPLPGS